MARTNTARKPRNNAMSTALANALHDKPQHVTSALRPRPENAVDIGPSIFDAVSQLSSAGQLVALRSIAASGIVGAVYAANQALQTYGTTHVKDDIALARANRLCRMYTWAKIELDTLGADRFNQPFTLDEAIAFASSNGRPAEIDAFAINAELLQYVGMTREEAQAAAEQARARQADRNQRIRGEVKDNADGIKSELHSFLYSTSGEDLESLIPATSQVALFAKVHKALSARMKSIVGNIMIGRSYDGAEADLGLLRGDVMVLDKLKLQFLRRNAGDAAVERMEDAQD